MQGQRDNACLFLITGAKGRLLLILSSCGCLQANTHALIYLFLFWKVEEPAFPYELSLPFKLMCACFCNNNVYPCLSLVVHPSGQVIVAI